MPPKPPLLNGDVVLVPFPFADLSANKVRPAVVVTADPQSSDLIVAFVTSVMTNHSPRGAEVPLLHADVEFHLTGLKMDSLIRLDKLVTLSSTLISRRLGKVGPATKARLGVMLRRTFGL